MFANLLGDPNARKIKRFTPLVSDINILEAGLFFRLDASNVLNDNIASIVMPIGIDHKDFLKKGTIDEIVFEKCSHLLENSMIVVSEQKTDVLKILQN